MIPILDSSKIALDKILPRQQQQVDAAIEQAVAGIITRVRQEGDAALIDCTEQFDRVRLSKLRVDDAELQAAWDGLDADFRAVLTQAADNIRVFHSSQLRQDIRLDAGQGIILGQRFTPIERVGVYVPGGTAAYPSSVLMNVIPARLAGCERIVMVTPPQADGRVNSDILAAAYLAGVTDVFSVGGAQAVAALAYGTQSVPQVDKIVGPGNIYVAVAKRQVFGQVAIDMIAGPSEILVVADSSADPRLVAADLLSQAEHDALAAAVLVTTERALAERVQLELEAQLDELPRADIARRSLLGQGKIILAPDMQAAIDIANRIAPEHLELALAEPWQWLDAVKNAGSIFLGHHTPEPLGDYWAGPNHVLPTLGTARFSGPLSVDDFIKRSSYLYYTAEALADCAEQVALFAQREGLDAHADSISKRSEVATS